MRSVLFGILLMLGVGVAHAAGIWGVGNESCGTYVSNPHDSLAKSHDISWVLGYVTASGIWLSYQHMSIAHVDANAMEIWLDNYCHAHPLDDLYVAVDALTATLIKRGNKQRQK